MVDGQPAFASWLGEIGDHNQQRTVLISVLNARAAPIEACMAAAAILARGTGSEVADFLASVAKDDGQNIAHRIRAIEILSTIAKGKPDYEQR